MTLMRRTTPFGEMLSLHQTMDRLLHDAFVRPRFAGVQGIRPGIALDVSSTADELLIEAALPGVKQQDVNITLERDILTISASTAQESETDERGYMHREVRRGSFSRSITLPETVDTEKATASFENGMLRLSIPRAEAAKPRQIQIGATPPAVETESGADEESN